MRQTVRRALLTISVMVFFFFVMGTGVVLASTVDIEGDLTYRFAVTPGQEIRGQLVIRNNDKEQPVQVAINQSDYLTMQMAEMTMASQGAPAGPMRYGWF